MLEFLFDKIEDLKVRKETPTQVFSCEYCKTFKNTFYSEHLQWLLLYNEILQKYLFNFFSHRLTSYESEKNNRDIFDLLKCTSLDIF